MTFNHLVILMKYSEDVTSWRFYWYLNYFFAKVEAQALEMEYITQIILFIRLISYFYERDKKNGIWVEICFVYQVS